MGLFDFFFSRSLSSVLNKTYKVKVHEVKFTIRKLDTMAFMAGYKALAQPFDVYKTNPEKKAFEQVVNAAEKMKEHFADVFLYAVIEPKLVRKVEESEQGIWVGNLFSDWDLATELYQKIMEVTYGKKKMKSLTSLKINS